jgi:hypothetical protein
VQATLRAEPDFGPIWSGHDEAFDASGQVHPTLEVLHVRFTSDRERHVRQLASLIQGDVCVVLGGVTKNRHDEVVDQLNSDANRRSEEWSWFAALGNSTIGQVDVLAEYDDGSLQRAMDQRFGRGVVHVLSGLQPSAPK